MLSTSTPARFPIPFANAAGLAFIRPIPTASQIGIQDGAASLTDGFPPDCFTPIVAGGVPPFGQDMNGLMYQATAWLQWLQAGGPVFYDTDFATAIGGYPKGALLTTSRWCPGTRWMSLVESNLVSPDNDGTGWTQDPNQVRIGTPIPFAANIAVPFGYVSAEAGTIGNSASNATLLANDAMAFQLFNYLWRHFPNSQCPVLNSSGVPVGRGASPIADYLANNQIGVLDFRGRSLTGVDIGGATGRLAGVPVISGAVTVAGSIFGENLHQLTLTELAAHAHANSLNDPTHIHGISDPTHSHGVTDPGHIHALTLLSGTQGLSTAGGTEGWGGGGFSHISINNGVSVDSHVTNISINAAPTGISVSTHATGMTITNANAGGDGSHNNVAQSMGVIWGLKL